MPGGPCRNGIAQADRGEFIEKIDDGCPVRQMLRS